MNSFIPMHHPHPSQHHPSLHPVLPLPIPQTAQPTWATHATLDEVDNDHDHSDDSGDDDVLNSAGGKKDKQVRRRSSKACDQCRKSKCKCERSSVPGEPCRNCVMLGTECTFLGPSRKRGPPKGYIDAIENRLHQTEALLGVLINSPDPRAVSLLQDISAEPSALQILERVTLSPYGSKGRKKRADGQEGHSHSRGKAEKHPDPTTTGALGSGRIQPFSVPIGEWQEGVNKRITDAARGRAARGERIEHGSSEEPLRDAIRRRTDSYIPPPAASTTVASTSAGNPEGTVAHKKSSASLRSHHSEASSPHGSQQQQLPSVADILIPSDSDSDGVASGVGQLSLNEHEQFRYHGKVSGLHLLGRHSRFDKRHEGGVWRFPQPRIYNRPPPTSNPSSFGLRSVNPPKTIEKDDLEREIRTRLPSKDVQKHLLDLFWTYVHPVIPVLDKEAVESAWRSEVMEDPKKGAKGDENGPTETVGDSPPSHASPSLADNADSSKTPPPTHKSTPRVPLLLLLAMFSISARFSGDPHARAPLPAQHTFWEATDSALADGYMADARMLLNVVYSSSRPSTCQALLLLSYREIGIGAMAAAWLYVGMAVRMAQDLGMHRKAERWVWKTNGNDGSSQVGTYPRGVFSERERQVRKKIWYACVIMDKYVSTYIGRPLSIFESDYDTPLPSENDPEETEIWIDDVSEINIVEVDGRTDIAPPGSKGYPVPMQVEPVQSHVLSCFNQSGKLSSILADIVTGIYSVKPPAHTTRQSEYITNEEKLDKWLFDLPEHLRLDKFQARHQSWQQENARRQVSEGDGNGDDTVMNLKEHECRCPCPPPHVFTLHMLYWCTVLLLHRPFIRARSQNTSGDQDLSLASVFHKPFDLCMTAAGHITSIATMYSEHFCLLRSPAFFTYYIFSAGIMYVTALSLQPDNPQAGLGLQKCLDCLKKMDRTWPSAGRQWELLQGSKLDPVREADLARLASHKGEQRHHKRAADELDAQQQKHQQHQQSQHQQVQPRRLSSASEVHSRSDHPTATVEPLRLTTSFPPSLAANSSNLSNHGSGRPTINTVLEPSSATSDHPISTPFSARPYHLGLDIQSPSSAGGALHHPASPRSLFPQYERWGDSAALGPTQSQQHSIFASLENSQLTSSMLPPRLPTSSERMPSYWNEYNDSSMMGSSLYSLPLMADAMGPGAVVGAGGTAGTGTFFSDAEYPIFNDHQTQNVR